MIFTKKKPVLLKHICWDLTGKYWMAEPERMYVNKHSVFHCSRSKTIHGGTPVQTIMYISITKGVCTIITLIRLPFIALFDDSNLIISMFHCLCPHCIYI